VVHVGGELRELAAAAEAGQRGDVPERPALVVGQHTLFDPSRAPTNQHTLYCYAHVPARYACSDEDLAGVVEDQLERFAPGFSSTVRARALRNPGRPRRRIPVWSTAILVAAATSSISSFCFDPPRSCVGIARRSEVCTSPVRPSIPVARFRAWAAGQRPGRC